MGTAILDENGSGQYCGTVLQAVTINASKKNVWKEISNIVGLPDWIADIKRRNFFQRRGMGLEGQEDYGFLTAALSTNMSQAGKTSNTSHI